MCEHRTIKAEAASLDEARKQIDADIHTSLRVLSENILCDDRPHKITDIGETTDAAFMDAMKKKSADAERIERQDVTFPERRSITVRTEDEDAAKHVARGQVGDGAVVEDIALTELGKRGFLGIGRIPSAYEVTIFQPAVIELTVKGPANCRSDRGEVRATLSTMRRVHGRERHGRSVPNRNRWEPRNVGNMLCVYENRDLRQVLTARWFAGSQDAIRTDSSCGQNAEHSFVIHGPACDKERHP